MSYCLLIKDKIINEGDIIDIVFENGIIDFLADLKKGNNVTKARISQINAELKNFYIFLIDHDTGIYISTTGLKSASIVRKSEMVNPNILFKHRSYNYVGI